MSAKLSIGEAARRLRVSVDTVRELERTGELLATRTSGGHRRFTAAALEAYVTRQKKSVGVRADDESDSTLSDSWDNSDLPVGANARPALATHREDRLPSESPLLRAVDQYFERARLNGLKTHGRTRIPFNASARARSAVIEALERYVNAARFPASMPGWESRQAIEAKVAAVLEPFTKEAVSPPTPSPAVASRTADRVLDDSRVTSLVAHGESRALHATTGWERVDAEDARADVIEALEDEVDSGWTECEVDELVDEILEEWQDESEE